MKSVETREESGVDLGVGWVEGGEKVEALWVERFEVGDGGLKEVGGFPELGGLVHVLVEPLVAEGEVELVDEEGELGVEGTEEGEDLLEELEGDEAVVG